ncbi:MAG: undecaprenyl/decaprenyl-phosphate alpha-N-acetylglucosaminyl 1-phosphate transferase, partial [Planctomycetes bacterium]|nr:undecaprenyl/decaprenyl-phosphate alpha-N-acetylglucosaminyl 1-phosphate transferase [Planctomycetota bacterium]
MNTFLYAYIGSVFLAVLLTPWVIRLARRIGALDRPGPRGVHERPIPRIGGVAIFLSAMCPIVAVLVLNHSAGAASRNVPAHLAALLGCSTLMFLVGLADDLKGMPARHKLLAELLIAGLLCCAGVRISSIALTPQWVQPLGGWGWLLTVVWIVGITNAVNLSDGLDGLAAGVCAIACGVIVIFALRSGQMVLAVFMLALLGSLCGFLIFNFNPARIFMGDSGSLFLGFTIGACSVMCVAKSAALVGLTLPALALGIPIFDTLFSALRRFLEDRSIFAPDRSHFHHRLLELGLQQRHAVILIYLATLLAAGLGLFMLVHDDLGALAIFGSAVLLILLLFRVVGVIHLRQTLTGLHQKYAHSRQQRDEQRTFERLQLYLRALGRTDRFPSLPVSFPAEPTPNRDTGPSSFPWWQVVCAAAEQLELAWVSLQATDANGGMETWIWRRPDTGGEGNRIPVRFARIMTLNFPIPLVVLEFHHGRSGVFERCADLADQGHDLVIGP